MNHRKTNPPFICPYCSIKYRVEENFARHLAGGYGNCPGRPGKKPRWLRWPWQRRGEMDLGKKKIERVRYPLRKPVRAVPAPHWPRVPAQAPVPDRTVVR
jgi:hypothetical protein